jgi:hypothetical protein
MGRGDQKREILKMAKFRLRRAHWAEYSGAAQLLAADTEIDTAELPAGWEPSPAVVPLDEEARAMPDRVISRILHAAGRATDIPGFGHRSGLLRECP